MMRFLVLLTALAAFGVEPPRLFYSKTFPGSTPAYVEITVEQNGKVEYREAPKEEDPLMCTLTEGEVKEMWALAEKLEWFGRNLESGLKVARMGDKLFRIENSDKKGETKFNYTQDLDGQMLLDWFEKISESALHRMQLERAVRFDKLGVNKALLQLEASWDRKRIVGPAQFLPLLDRVAKNEAYLHMARERAASLGEMIRNLNKAKSE
ncbi:MAG: hypothetical protein HY820_19875 [Acidobacteria bacterium]|nr:hypothetical protein [Acidobacteriota bacterium]